MSIKQDINNSRIEFENKIKQESDNLDKKKLETELSLIKIKDEVEKEIQKEKLMQKEKDKIRQQNSINSQNNSQFNGTFAPKSAISKQNSKNEHNLSGDLSREDFSKADSPVRSKLHIPDDPNTKGKAQSTKERFQTKDPIIEEPFEKPIIIREDTSPQGARSPFESVSPFNMGSPLDDISPIGKDSSVSNIGLNKRELSEKEVPLDFNDGRRSPVENPSSSTPRLDDLSDTKIEQIVIEETALYMPGPFLCDEIFDFKNNYSKCRALHIMPLENTPGEYLIVG